MITTGTETIRDVESAPVAEPIQNETDFLTVMPPVTTTGVATYGDGLFPPLGLVGAPNVTDPLQGGTGITPVTAYDPSGVGATDLLFDPLGLGSPDPTAGVFTPEAASPIFPMVTTASNPTETAATPEIGLSLMPMMAPIALAGTEPNEAPTVMPMMPMTAAPTATDSAPPSILSTPLMTMPMMDPLALALPETPMPMPMMPMMTTMPTNTPMASTPMTTMPMMTGYGGGAAVALSSMNATLGAPVATPAAATSTTTRSTSRASSGGGTSSSEISSMWNVQFQGGDGLETYGDSDGEGNYGNIPSEYYSENSDGSITLSSNGDDSGSANSKYPRTELREKDEWDIMSGSHKMSAEYTEITGGRQTIMQIHFSDNAQHPDEPPIRLEMIDGELVVETRQKAGLDGSESTSLGRPEMPLNIDMEVVDGKVQVIVNGEMLYEEEFDWDGEGESAYFKAGTYNHSGADTSVTMSSMEVEHS